MKISFKQTKEIRDFLRNSECSQFTKEDILANIEGEENFEKAVKVSTVKGKLNLECNMGCFKNLFFKEEEKKEVKL
jgi:hypothetical protein